MPSSSIALHQVVTQSPDLVATSIEGQTALMSIENGAYYGMDPVGSRIWALIEQPRARSAVVDQLLREFSVERTVCEQQVLAFLQKLAETNLVRVLDDASR